MCARGSMHGCHNFTLDPFLLPAIAGHTHSLTHTHTHSHTHTHTQRHTHRHTHTQTHTHRNIAQVCYSSSFPLINAHHPTFSRLLQTLNRSTASGWKTEKTEFSLRPVLRPCRTKTLCNPGQQWAWDHAQALTQRKSMK